MAIAPGRFDGLYKSEIIECAAGLQPASPTPTPTRASASSQKFCAAPDNAVMTLHSAGDIEKTLLRAERSTSRPSGTPAGT